MRLGWALLLGVAGGVALAWWLSRDTPEQARDKHARAESAAAANIEDARPVLYRWRDAAGNLHVTATPPTGRRYERIQADAEPGIEVHGDRR